MDQVNGALGALLAFKTQVGGTVESWKPKNRNAKPRPARVSLHEDNKAYQEATRQLDLVRRNVASRLRPPDGPCASCDFNALERWANVVTSLPYAVVGAHMLRKCKKPWTRAYAVSQIAVGATAAAYHASTGPVRVWMRRLDYWAIALGSAVMTRAVHPQLAWPATLASVAATPFQPFAVSAANTTAMELEYLKVAARCPELRRDHLIHCCAAAAGLGLFALDEIRPGYPLCHAAWHVLSSASVAHTLKLMHHAEKRL